MKCVSVGCKLQGSEEVSTGDSCKLRQIFCLPLVPASLSIVNMGKVKNNIFQSLIKPSNQTSCLQMVNSHLNHKVHKVCVTYVLWSSESLLRLRFCDGRVPSLQSAVCCDAAKRSSFLGIELCNPPALIYASSRIGKLVIEAVWKKIFCHMKRPSLGVQSG